MTTNSIKKLEELMYYMNMTELRQACKQLKLPHTGLKALLISRIMTFIETGKIVTVPPIPEISKAKKGHQYPLAPQTKILLGSYKNDLKTRIFMKSLVGNHFHFTAFGQDWMKQRWQEGNPPTYAEFARFWQAEHERRKNKQSPLKQEWALLNFMRRYQEEHPNAGQKEMMRDWKKERATKAHEAMTLLKKVAK